MLLLASGTPSIPFRACSDSAPHIRAKDSVSMVSEAVTAGREVFLLGTGSESRARTILQGDTAFLVRKKLLPGTMLWVFHGSMPFLIL